MITHLHNPNIIHYLDNFLIAGPPHNGTCLSTFTGVEALCHKGGETNTPPSTLITFLGIQIDTVAQILTLPPDKLASLLQELKTFSTLHRCTKRALLSLIGKLAFAAKVTPAGRIFLRRLIDASTCAHSLHHHVHISPAVKADIHWPHAPSQEGHRVTAVWQPQFENRGSN